MTRSQHSHVIPVSNYRITVDSTRTISHKCRQMKRIFTGLTNIVKSEVFSKRSKAKRGRTACKIVPAGQTKGRTYRINVFEWAELMHSVRPNHQPLQSKKQYPRRSVNLVTPGSNPGCATVKNPARQTTIISHTTFGKTEPCTHQNQKHKLSAQKKTTTP